MSTSEQSIAQAFNNAVEPFSNAVVNVIFFSIPINGTDTPLIVLWLVAAAVFFTVYFRFLNLRGFGLAVRIATGKLDSMESNRGSSGEISHLQALTTAVSGTVGNGNIAGVAVAIGLGGPGAVLWMMLAGLFGMSLKMVECTLGVLYRKEFSNGAVSGGPWYYLSQGFAERGFPLVGRALAIFCAVACIGFAVGAGSLFQVNQSYQQFSAITGVENGFLYGLAVAIFVGAVIIGGIRSIGRVTVTLVPLMCGIYILAALVVIALNITALPGAIATIVREAFAPTAAAGGFVGAMVQGLRRATFSNEAGSGSATVAHSAVRTDEPATQGLVAMLEPFIDTVLVCSMTAIVIVITGAYLDRSLVGISLTSAAFGGEISWFPYVIAIASILFALSTLISWSYYGVRAFCFLAGETRANELAFRIFFCLTALAGGVLELKAVVDFSDAMIFAMAFPNVIGLYVMAPQVKLVINDYISRIRSAAAAPAAP